MAFIGDRNRVCKSFANPVPVNLYIIRGTYKDHINSSHLLHPPFLSNVFKYSLLLVVDMFESLQQTSFAILRGSILIFISMET